MVVSRPYQANGPTNIRHLHLLRICRLHPYVGLRLKKKILLQIVWKDDIGEGREQLAAGWF